MVSNDEPSVAMPLPDKLSMTLTFETMTLKMSSVVIVNPIISNHDKFHWNM